MIVSGQGLPGDFDLDHWLRRAIQHRADDGAYAYESVALDLIRKFGFNVAAVFARNIGEMAGDAQMDDEGCWVYRFSLYGDAMDREQLSRAAAMFEVLEWHQAALLAAWFQRRINRDAAREVFPNSGAITSLPQK